MEKFTPLAKILHCRRQWREGKISPLQTRQPSLSSNTGDNHVETITKFVTESWALTERSVKYQPKKFGLPKHKTTLSAKRTTCLQKYFWATVKRMFDWFLIYPSQHFLMIFCIGMIFTYMIHISDCEEYKYVNDSVPVIKCGLPGLLRALILSYLL